MSNLKTAIRCVAQMFLIAGLFLTGAIIPAQGANWYVRPGATGSNNGTDWNNAWSMSSLNWNSVNPGDTIWLAGGSYTTQLAINKSGTAGNLIYIKRPLATDASPTSAAGWSTSFDSQVVISPTAGGLAAMPILWPTLGVGSFVYIDGRVDSGIRAFLNKPNQGTYCGAVTIRSGNQQNITLAYIDMAGPAPNSTAFLRDIYDSALCLFGYTSKVNPISNVLVKHCRLHGGANIVTAHTVTGLTIEHSELYDNACAGDPAIYPHANIFEMHNCTSFTLRYSLLRDWQVEGYRPYGFANGVYIYGNVWYGPGSTYGVARCFEADSGVGSPWGPIYIYNNTFINIPLGVFMGTSGKTVTSSSLAANNLFYNSSVGSASAMGIAVQNSVTANAATFVSSTDFRLRAGANAINAGAALAVDGYINIDKEGKLRGADGSWDVGAYEYGLAAGSTNPVIAVTTAGLDFGSVAVGTATNFVMTIQNIGGGTLAGSASVSLPFSIVSGGTYSLGSNRTQSVTVRYAPTAVGTHSQTMNFSGGGGAAVLVRGSAWTVLSGLSFAATDGTIASPFSVDAGGNVFQSSESGLVDGGRAVYAFVVTNAGDYEVSMVVNAPDLGADSLYVNIDAEPTDPTMIWDILPLTGAASFETRKVGWRGNGTSDAPEFEVRAFPLSVGNHQLIVRGREGSVKFGRISIAKRITPPDNLHLKN